MDNSRGQPRLERMALNALLRWRRKFRLDTKNSHEEFLEMLVKADRLAAHNANLSALVRKIKRQMHNAAKPAGPATENK